jgi:hypothetical protein
MPSRKFSGAVLGSRGRLAKDRGFVKGQNRWLEPANCPRLAATRATSNSQNCSELSATSLIPQTSPTSDQGLKCRAILEPIDKKSRSKVRIFRNPRFCATTTKDASALQGEFSHKRLEVWRDLDDHAGILLENPKYGYKFQPLEAKGVLEQAAQHLRQA